MLAPRVSCVNLSFACRKDSQNYHQTRLLSINDKAIASKDNTNKNIAVTGDVLKLSEILSKLLSTM